MRSGGVHDHGCRNCGRDTSSKLLVRTRLRSYGLLSQLRECRRISAISENPLARTPYNIQIPIHFSGIRPKEEVPELDSRAHDTTVNV
jgi:hypothetical protein